jgi:hypothetical protein
MPLPILLVKNHYRATKALHKAIGRDKSRSYARNALPILVVKNHYRALAEQTEYLGAR